MRRLSLDLRLVFFNFSSYILHFQFKTKFLIFNMWIVQVKCINNKN